MDGRKKINDQTVLSIKKRILNGERQVDIAHEFGLSQGYISGIKLNIYYEDVGEDISAESNYWSFWSPKYRKLICKLYEKDKLNEYEIADRVNEMIKNKEAEPTKGKCHQSHVHLILTAGKVKIRGQKILKDEFLPQILDLRRQGLTQKEIGKKYGVRGNTVWAYLKRHLNIKRRK